MESIDSTEKFGNVSTELGEPPKHTEPGHERCAYYLNHGQDEIECTHEQMAEGAFYSEDYVNQLRVACQKFYTAMAAGNHKMTGTEMKLFMQIRELTK